MRHQTEHSGWTEAAFHCLLPCLKKKQYSFANPIALDFPLEQLLPASRTWQMSKTDMARPAVLIKYQQKGPHLELDYRGGVSK